MTHVSLPPTTMLALGIAEINCRQPVKKVRIQAAAKRLVASLSGGDLRSATDAIRTGIAGHDALWSDEIKIAGFRNTVLEARSLLHRSLELRFDGVDMLVAKADPDGWAAGAAEMVMQRTFPEPTIFASAGIRAEVRAGLAAALNAADYWVADDLNGSGTRDRLLEDHELKPKRTAPAKEMPAPMLFTLREFLQTNPSADVVDLQRHLRGELKVQLAARSVLEKRFAHINPSTILEHFGVDQSPDSCWSRKERLDEEVDKRDVSDRLDRLLISSVPETMLHALTQSFRTANPDGTTAELMAHLRAGMERMQGIRERLDDLGNASRYGYVKAAKFLELADFDAAGTVIEEVRALAEKMAAKGTPFLPPAPPRRTCRHHYLVEIPSFKRVEPAIDDLLPSDCHFKRDVHAAALNGPPVRYARAAAEFGKHLARDRQQITEAQFRDRLQLSIGWWQAAKAHWTRADNPRKWGVLSCNIADALAELSCLDSDLSGLGPALATMQSAKDALEGEAWCYAAAHSAFLRIRSDMIRHGVEPLPAGTGLEVIPGSSTDKPTCTANPTVTSPYLQRRLL